MKPSRIFAHPLFWVFVVIFMGAYPIFLAVQTKLPPVLPVVAPMPAFPGGEEVVGRVFVADFFSLDCAAVCQNRQKRMFELQHKGRNLGPSFHLVSFVVDGEGKAAAVEERARALRASPRMWLFVPGAPGVIVETLRQALLDPSGLLEGRWLVLVDPKGRIRAVYDADEPDVVKRVLIDAGLIVNRGH